jgi:hypothetical protein
MDLNRAVRGSYRIVSYFAISIAVWLVLFVAHAHAWLLAMILSSFGCDEGMEHA